MAYVDPSVRAARSLFRVVTGGDGRSAGQDGAALVRGLAEAVPAIREAARREDRFPVEVLDRLRTMGVLAAPLPAELGGAGWGTSGGQNLEFCAALRSLGYGSLAVGRIYEAHVNAIHLIQRYGTARVQAEAWRDVRRGQLFGLWVASAREPVCLLGGGEAVRVAGTKPYCTAAGFATRAVITALDEQGGERMLLVDATRAHVSDASPQMHGMRGTSTRPVTFDLEVSAEQCIGVAGDYFREPEFSGGAWRTSAVTVGGLQALVDETIRQLRARGRHTDPHQSERIGQMLIRCTGATMWVAAAAERAASATHEPAEVTAFINLARVAVERSSLDVIALVQRSLGMASVLIANPAEQLIRDLDTYLRQPAADEALSEAAVHFAETGGLSRPELVQ